MAVYADQEIINGCLKKDKVYEEYLYKKYYSIFLVICMRYTKDLHTAKLLLNDGFVKIFMSMAHFRNEGSFEGWMRKIMVNTCLMHLKSSDFKKSSQTVFTGNIEESSTVVYNQAINNMDAAELIAMLQSLPPVTRTVFNLFVFEGYNHNEIGGLLGISAGTSSWHIHHARGLLQQKILIKKQAI